MVYLFALQECLRFGEMMSRGYSVVQHFLSWQPLQLLYSGSALLSRYTSEHFQFYLPLSWGPADIENFS